MYVYFPFKIEKVIKKSVSIVNPIPILPRAPYYTEQEKKKGKILAVLPVSVLVESGYIGYEMFLTAIFHIGLCDKFRSSVKRLSRQ